MHIRELHRIRRRVPMSAKTPSVNALVSSNLDYSITRLTLLLRSGICRNSRELRILWLETSPPGFHTKTLTNRLEPNRGLQEKTINTSFNKNKFS